MTFWVAEHVFSAKARMFVYIDNVYAGKRKQADSVAEGWSSFHSDQRTYRWKHSPACTYTAFVTIRPRRADNVYSGLLLPIEFRRRCVCRSVCSMVTSVYCGKTAETIELPFGVVGWVDARNRCACTSTLPGKYGWIRLCAVVIIWSATTSGDAACSQIISGNLVAVIV